MNPILRAISLAMVALPAVFGGVVWAQGRPTAQRASRQDNANHSVGVQVNGGSHTTINLLPPGVQACGSPALQMPDVPASWPACALKPTTFSGTAQLDARMRLTFRAATPGWANSPYNFRVEILQGERVVASTDYAKPSPSPSPTEFSYDWAPSGQVTVVAGRQLQLTVRVTAVTNWTYRSGQFNNPPDTVEVSNFQPSLRRL